MGTESTTWMADAACAQVDPELFFPETDDQSAYAAQASAAKAVCARCPVRSACLAWATEHLTHGIAGGLDADRRRGMRRAQKGRAA
jgi:hypothetical protein